MQTDWTQCDARVLVYEGGKVDNPKDPGGRTNQGVTQATYNAYRREKGEAASDVYAMTAVERDDIYKTHYWDAIQADKLPAGVDFACYDPAVNSGPGHAIIWLQQSLGESYKGAIDGGMGLKTLQAIEDFGDNAKLVQAICARRLGTLEKLSTWKEFGAGWHARIANVQKTSLAMVSNNELPHAVDVTSKGGHNKAPINIPPSKISQGVAHATTAVSGAGVIAAQAASGFAPLQQTFPHWHWLTVLIASLTATSATAGVLTSVSDKAKTLAASGARVGTVDIDADDGLPQISVMSVQPAGA